MRNANALLLVSLLADVALSYCRFIGDVRFKRQDEIAAPPQSPIDALFVQFLQRLAANLKERHANINNDFLRNLNLAQFGLCDRTTCPDLYKMIDDFRQSELYDSFTTLVNLMQEDNPLQVLLTSIVDVEALKGFFGNYGNLLFPGIGNSQTTQLQLADALLKKPSFNAQTKDLREIYLKDSSVQQERMTQIELARETFKL